MYWPLGAPRIYSTARRRRKEPSAVSNGGEAEGAAIDPAEVILGLTVARNGHLLVTITESSIYVWQATVS